MLSSRTLYLAASAVAVLVLLSPPSAAGQSLDVALSEPGCPAVTADILVAFTTNADGSTPVTRDQAAALACHLQPVLARAAAGEDAAQGTLTAMYTVWRQAFHPQSWGAKPTDAKSNWVANLQAVVSINSNPASSFWAGLNAYSALSTDDFAAAVLMTPTAPAGPAPSNNNGGNSRKLLARASMPKPPTYPSLIDWATAGKVLPQPGFQAMCGSSWAYAAAADLESKLMIDSQANTTAALSAQHIMDCTARMFAYPTSGCNGGSLTDAFQYAGERGVTTAEAYCYRPQTPGADVDAKGFLLQCDRAFLTGKAAKAGLVRISAVPIYKQVSPASSKLGLIQALAVQPAVTTLAVDASFQHYAGGIWSSTTWAGATPNHSLLLVGYNTLAAGQEHFVAKNSLGAGWGEAGFVRLAMVGDGQGICGMYRAAFQPAAVTAIAPVQAGNSQNQ